MNKEQQRELPNIPNTPHLQDHQGTEKANNVGKPLPTSGSHLLLTGIYSNIECNEGNIHLYR